MKTNRVMEKYCTMIETLAGILYPPISASFSHIRSEPAAAGGYSRKVSFSIYYKYQAVEVMICGGYTSS